MISLSRCKGMIRCLVKFGFTTTIHHTVKRPSNKVDIVANSFCVLTAGHLNPVNYVKLWLTLQFF